MAQCRMALLLLLVGIAVVVPKPTVPKDKVLVCYFGSWAVYRPGAGKFDVEDIDPTICTHVIYEFSGLSKYEGVMVSLDPLNDLYDHDGRGAFTRFTKLKEKNPNLKTLLAIGGWKEGSEKYSDMISNVLSRKYFLKNAVDFLKKYGFDGLDFDWQYPSQRGGKPEDKENFVAFLSDMRAIFDKHDLMMTAAVSPLKGTIDPAYDIPAMGKHLDLINVMCYDYHGSWDTFTGHHSPLYRNPLDYGDFVYSNINFTMNYWIQNGAPTEKLVMGVGLHGRTFTLSQEDKTGLYAPASRPGTSGPYTREAGFIGYNEICEQKKENPSAWTEERDEYIMAPYSYSGNQWIGYDDQDSMKTKARFAVSLGLKGIMAWSIETDDYHGGCHGVNFPLLTAILDGLNGGDVPTPPTPTSVTPSSETPPPPTSTVTPSSTVTTDNTISTMPPDTTTTSSPTLSPDDICKKIGMNADPNDCAVFYLCKKDDSGQWELEQYRCGAGAVFDPEAGDCTWPSNVPGCEDYYGSSTTSTSEISTTPKDTTTTSSPTLSPDDICKKPGMNADPNDCAVFYLCNKDDAGQWQITQFRCGAGTVFDPVGGDCTWASDVPGCEDYNGSSTTSTTESSTILPPGTTSTTSPEEICREPGIIPDTKNCTAYYICSYDESGKLDVVNFFCENGLVFDPSLLICNTPSTVPGCKDYYGRGTPTKPTTE